MLLAQAMGEYGAMAGLASAIQSGLAQAENLVRGLGMKEFVILLFAGIVLMKVFGRR